MIKVKEKKMKNKIISCLLVLFILSLSLMTQLVVPAYADPKAGEETASADDSKDQADETEAQELKAEEDGTVVISTTEEFLEVAQACSLDTWSQGKTIVLDADISLENTEYLPIPTFGGTFDGKGYTISGLTITNSVTPAGLFGVLQETGVVKNLNVSGDVSPSGDADVVGGIAGENNGTIENCTYTGSVSGKQNTGGIAGINGTTGNIKKCNVSGTISGENMTGGIAGYNLGEIASSQNDSYVNIESVDPSLSPEDINLDFLTDVSKLYSLDTSINGDINVGGIVGTMAIEYELDPEDDDTSSVSGRNRREFELKAILIKCCNTGKVSAKRNYTGSVCGHMDLGLISECEGYGDTESENGDYVGGIAGVASGIVRNSYAKCTLKGKNYIGGIVGTGVTADKTGSSSSVTGCYAQMDIPEYEQYAGGISGAEAGEFADNYYVSDDLAAINRMSYSGKAEPIEYSKLLEVEGLPEEFKQLTVQFVAENETLKTVTCNYGESLDDSVYPEIPQRKGYYAKWDITELTDLRFDTVVTAVYSQYTTALEDSKVRDDGRTIFYVEGQFGDGDEADFEEQSQISSDIAVVSTDVSGALESYFSFLDDASMPSDTISREVVEQWKVTLPDDGLSEHTVRYLAPKGKKDNLDVYVRQDGDVKWEKVETEEVGSYLSFPVSGTISEIAIVSTLPMQWAWAIVIALLLLVLFLLIRMVRKKILRHRARKALEMEVEEMEEADEEESETVEPNSETEMNSEESSVEDTRKQEKKKKDKKAKKKKKGKKDKKKKCWLIPLILFLVILCIVSAGVIWFLTSDLRTGMEAYNLLKEYNEQEELTMELNVQAEVGDERVDTVANITRTNCDGYNITCVEQFGISLYYYNGTVYLENGKAFEISSLFPDYSEIIGQAADLYHALTITQESNKEGRLYSIVAEGKDARSLLEILVPQVADELSDAQVIRIELQENQDEIDYIHFSANGTLNDNAKTDVTVEADLTTMEYDSQAANIPTKVKKAVKRGTKESNNELTEDLFRILSAWKELEGRDHFASNLQLSADCGPIAFNDNLQMLRVNEEDLTIYCIQKNGNYIYFTDKAICNQYGNAVETGNEELMEAAKLWNIAYQTCLNGDFNCTGSGDRYIYTLKLDQEGMESVAYAIAPEAKKLGVSLESGSIQITLNKEHLRMIHFSCSGSVKVVTADVPVSLNGDVRIDDADTELEFSVPESVIQTLGEEE